MTINRRDILFGTACLAALGCAEALRPRTRIVLKGDDALTDMIPKIFGDWTMGEGGDIVIPKVPGSLADKLYSDTLTRRYVNKRSGEYVMLLIAYGQAQSDILQLHRPESCYPAVGLPIQQRMDHDIHLGTGATVPAVALTAGSGRRTEDIVYWTRLGEYLPRSAADQRRDRLKSAMAGIIGDGVLVRASIVRFGDTPAYALLDQFLASLIDTLPATDRRGLVGTQRAGSISDA